MKSFLEPTISLLTDDDIIIDDGSDDTNPTGPVLGSGEGSGSGGADGGFANSIGDRLI